MSNQEIINLLLTVGLLIMAVCAILISYFLIRALKAITNLADALQNTTENIREKVQMNILQFVPAIAVGLISRFLKKRG